MNAVEARGRQRALDVTASLAAVAVLLLGGALVAVQRGHLAIPRSRSLLVLTAGAVVVLVIVFLLAVQCLETLAPLDPSQLSRVLLGIAAGCAVGAPLVVVAAAGTAWRLIRAHPLDVVQPVAFWPVQFATLLLAAGALLGWWLATRPLRPLGRQPAQAARERHQSRHESPAGAPWGVTDPDAEVICCSGGGIRSAAFCLGALGRLAETGRYQRAAAVFGVSGGSWIAAAFHALHRQLPPERPDDARTIFGLDSAELRRFRRDTRYLSSSARQRVLLTYSFVSGLAINLILVVATMRVGSWFVGWLLTASGTVSGCPACSTSLTAGVSASPLLLVVPALLVLSPVSFLAARLLEASTAFPGQTMANQADWGSRHSVSRWSRIALTATLDQLTVPVLRVGLLAAVVWPGIPLVSIGLAALRRALAGTPIVSGVVATLASWTSGGPAALAALASAAVAFAGLVRSSLKGPTTPGPQTGGGAVFAFVRTSLAPWLGSLLVLGGGCLVLVHWSLGYARALGQPSIDGTFGLGASGLGDAGVDGWLLAAVAAVIVLPVATTANLTTLYPFYRDSLAEAYLMRLTAGSPVSSSSSVAAGTAVDARVEALGRQDLPTFSALGSYATASSGPHRQVTPSLVLCATANVSDRFVVPVGRRATAFRFASSGIGLPDPHLPAGGAVVEPAAYERVANPRDCSLAAAMAISGAAVAPVAGRESRNVNPYRLIMALANLRLGVWLRNPYWVQAGSPDQPWPAQGWRRAVRRLADLASSPGPGMILREGLGWTSLYARYLYITDGGHLDNLGLVEALRGAPGRVIVLDASADAEDTFVTLAHAIATARMDLGVEVAGFDLTLATRGDAAQVRRGWATGRAIYPDGSICEILYIKALYVQGVSLDVSGYRCEHPDFPLTGTANQLYDEFDLEAFRQLGHLIAEQALAEFPETSRGETPRGQTARGVN